MYAISPREENIRYRLHQLGATEQWKISKGHCRLSSSDIIAKVSGLSAVIGDVTSIRGDGRMMAWAGKDDYWFWLVVEPATSLNEKRRNTFRVLIDEAQAPDDLLYNAVGYCVYHDIEHEFVFDTDKHQMAGFLALDRMGHNA